MIISITIPNKWVRLIYEIRRIQKEGFGPEVDGGLEVEPGLRHLTTGKPSLLLHSICYR